MREDAKPSGRVVIAGGAGHLGTSLSKHLSDRGCDVAILSRHAEAVEGASAVVRWDGRSLGNWADILNGATALVNLAGRSVDCIKSPDHCDEILRSRVESTQALGRAVRSIHRPPPVWVQMSTAHIYGDPPTEVCDEDSPPGYGLAPFVGQAWETACRESLLPTMRAVILRTSFVLASGGGALRRLERVVRWGFGGTVGNGRQGMSWIHGLDMNRLFTRAIADETMQGTYVATAANPVSNRVFMRELRRALHQPIGLPAAGWMVRLGAPLLMRTDPDLALYGRYCVSRRLREEGFQFTFPDLGPALDDIMGRDSSCL